MRGSPSLAARLAKEKKKRRRKQSGADLFSRVSTVGACSWIECCEWKFPLMEQKEHEEGRRRGKIEAEQRKD